MASERRARLLLGVLGVVLVAALYWTWPASTSGGSFPSSNVGGNSRTSARAKTEMTAPEVHLNALSDGRPKPADSDRNLFRFKPKAPPAPPPSQRPALDPVPPVPTG